MSKPTIVIFTFLLGTIIADTYTYTHRETDKSIAIAEILQTFLKIRRGSEFGSITANDHHFDSNIFVPFSTFSMYCWKQQVLYTIEITKDFQTFLTDYDKGTLVQQKLCDAIGIAAQISRPFPGGEWVAWIKVKTPNTSGTMQPIFFICFHRVFGKIMVH